MLQNYMKDEFYAMADQFGVMIHNGRSKMVMLSRFVVLSISLTLEVSRFPEMMFSDCDYSKAVQASYGSNDTHSFLPNAAAEVQHQV